MHTQNFNELTPAETERLAILAEEMGETIQVIGKILRHGYDSRNPLEGEKGLTNRAKLEKEIADVFAILVMMEEAMDVDGADIESQMIVKSIKIQEWLHHQEDEEDD